MSGKQELVAAGGTTLLVLYLTSSGDAHAIYENLSTPFDKSSHATSDAAKAATQNAGKAVLGLLAATLIAGASDDAGTIILVVVVGLLILWAMNHFGGGDTPAAPKFAVPKFGKKQGTTHPGGRTPETS